MVIFLWSDSKHYSDITCHKLHSKFSLFTFAKQIHRMLHSYKYMYKSFKWQLIATIILSLTIPLKGLNLYFVQWLWKRSFGTPALDLTAQRCTKCKWRFSSSWSQKNVRSVSKGAYHGPRHHVTLMSRHGSSCIWVYCRFWQRVGRCRPQLLYLRNVRQP